MARSIVINLIGNNRTSPAFRGAARDADRTAGSLDRLGGAADDAGGRLGGLSRSSRDTGGHLAVLRGQTASMVSALVAVGPAAGAAAAATVAAAGAMAAAYGSAGAALGAFSLAVRPQLNAVGEAAKAHAKAQEAAASGGAKAAAANKAYQQSLAKLPPATRATAVGFIGLQGDFKKWSDSLSGDTMPVFTKGINIARGILPKLTPLVKTAAGALSRFMDELGKGAKSKGFTAFLGRINAAAAKTLPALLRSAKNVAVGVAGIFDAFLPHSGAMATSVEGLTAKFAKWGKALKDSDSFKGFIVYVRANLPALSTTFGNLVAIVINLAKAFAPMTGISLLLVKNFTAMLAALPPPVVTALATAFAAASLAAKIWVPIQTALNVVLSANPIGIVVLALAALAVGLVLAYKKSETFRAIVNGVWAGVKTAVSTAWTQYIRPALQGLASLFSKAAGVWESKWPAMQQLLTEMSAFFHDTLQIAIDTVAGAFSRMGGKADEATQKITGVGAGFGSTQTKGNQFLTWSTIFGAGIGTAILGPLGGILGGITGWFWPQTKQGFIDGITWIKGNWRDLGSDMIHTQTDWANKIVGGVRSFVGRARNALFGGLPPLRADWTSFWNWVHAFVGRIGDLVVRSVKGWGVAMRGAFSAGVQAIKTVWDKLRGVAKAPVNFMIGTVFNKGVVGLWNKVMGWLHVGGMTLHTLPLLARGGTLDNPAPATPMTTNGPMAIVGEGRQSYPEFVIPTDPKYRGRAQALWAAAGGKLQMLAGGGVLGDVLGGIKKAAGKVLDIGKMGLDLIANPGKVWDSLAGPVLASASGTGAGPWAGAIAAIPGKLLDAAKGAALQVVKAFKAGFGGGGNMGAVNAARAYIGTPYLWGGTSKAGIDCSGLTMRGWKDGANRDITRTTYTQRSYMKTIPGPRPGAVGQPHAGHTYMASRVQGGKTWVVEAARSGTNVSEHPLTRATPWWGYPPGLARGGIVGRLAEAFVEGDPGAGLAKYLGLAGDPGGVVPGFGPVRTATYDSGGLLHPGYTLAYNGTGKAEVVSKLASGGKLRSSKDTVTIDAAARSKTGSGLLKQITSAMLSSASKIASFFTSLNTQIRKFNTGAGEKKLLAWSAAIQKAMNTAATKAADIAAKIAAAKEYAAGVTTSAKDFASLSGLGAKGSAKTIASGLSGRADTLGKFAGQLTQLKARGLSTTLLSQIIGMGAGEGSGLAATLLAGSPETLTAINAAQSRIDTLAGQLGDTAANVMYDSGSAAGKGFLSGLYAQQKALNAEMDRLGQRLASGVRSGFKVGPKFRAGQAVSTAKYDSGGMLQPGWTLAYNATGRPEPVFPSVQAAASYGDGGTGVREVHLHFPPGAIVVNERADVDMLIQQIEFRLRAAAL